jgi:hypothetical protein
MYYASHMETFTEVMVYLNEGMDLIHHDITGTMTSRAAEDALEPDKKPKRLHPDEFKIVRKALLLDEIVPVDWPNPANTSLDLPPAEPASDPLEGRDTETPPLQLEWEGEDHE